MSFLRLTGLFKTHTPQPHIFKSTLFFRPRTLDAFFRPSHPFGLNVAQRSFSTRTALNASRKPPRDPRRSIEEVKAKFARFQAEQASFNSPRNKNIVIYSFIGLNCAIFAYYHYTVAQAQGGVRKPLQDFVQNFTMNVSEIKEGRWWTLVTCNYTHMGLMHILGNLISFHVFASMLTHVPYFSALRLTSVILSSGIAGSLFQFYTRNRQLKDSGRRDMSRGLGFSGAVMGVGSLAACLFPHQKLLLYGVVPVPFWLLIGGYFVYDGYFLGSQNTGVAHGGHLGGLMTGLLFFARYRFFPRW